MKTQKDNRIELYRFLTAFIIVIFHAHNINNGYGHPIPLGHVFVEFFFFLTGYYTYASMIKKINDNRYNIDISNYPFHYTWRKFKKFIPYSIMTSVLYVGMSIIGDHFIKGLSIRDSILDFSGLPFDILFLQITGIYKNSNFNAWWYLSAILFTMPIVIILFYRKYVRGGVYTYIVYFSPLLIYGAFSENINGLDWNSEVFGIFKTGIFRGIAGICMGCLIYDLKNRLCSIKSNIFSKMIFTIIEFGAYSMSFFMAWKWSEVENSTFLIIILLVIGLTVTFSNKSYTTVLNKQILGYLGMLSLPLYMCHYSIGRLIGKYFIYDNMYVRYILYLGSSIAFSICMLFVDRKILRRVKNEVTG